MLLNDTVKINFIRQGFLMDVPYHLISDEEMLQAFISDDGYDFFHIMYPLVDKSLEWEYGLLESGIKSEVQNCLDAIKQQKEYTIPDWIYSYMLGAVIGPKSNQQDKHDLFVLLGCDNIDDEFNLAACKSCYKASVTWLNKYAYRDESLKMRPATIFGEPHVLKYLRLQAVDALRGGN